MHFSSRPKRLATKAVKKIQTKAKKVFSKECPFTPQQQVQKKVIEDRSASDILPPPASLSCVTNERVDNLQYKNSDQKNDALPSALAPECEIKDLQQNVQSSTNEAMFKSKVSPHTTRYIRIDAPTNLNHINEGVDLPLQPYLQSKYRGDAFFEPYVIEQPFREASCMGKTTKVPRTGTAHAHNTSKQADCSLALNEYEVPTVTSTSLPWSWEDRYEIRRPASTRTVMSEWITSSGGNAYSQSSLTISFSASSTLAEQESSTSLSEQSVSFPSPPRPDGRQLRSCPSMPENLAAEYDLMKDIQSLPDMDFVKNYERLRGWPAGQTTEVPHHHFESQISPSTLLGSVSSPSITVQSFDNSATSSCLALIPYKRQSISTSEVEWVSGNGSPRSRFVMAVTHREALLHQALATENRKAAGFAAEALKAKKAVVELQNEMTVEGERYNDIIASKDAAIEALEIENEENLEELYRKYDKKIEAIEAACDKKVSKKQEGMQRAQRQAREERHRAASFERRMQGFANELAATQEALLLGRQLRQQERAAYTYGQADEFANHDIAEIEGAGGDTLWLPTTTELSQHLIEIARRPEESDALWTAPFKDLLKKKDAHIHHLNIREDQTVEELVDTKEQSALQLCEVNGKIDMLVAELGDLESNLAVVFEGRRQLSQQLETAWNNVEGGILTDEPLRKVLDKWAFLERDNKALLARLEKRDAAVALVHEQIAAVKMQNLELRNMVDRRDSEIVRVKAEIAQLKQRSTGETHIREMVEVDCEQKLAEANAAVDYLNVKVAELEQFKCGEVGDALVRRDNKIWEQEQSIGNLQSQLERAQEVIAQHNLDKAAAERPEIVALGSPRIPVMRGEDGKPIEESVEEQMARDKIKEGHELMESNFTYSDTAAIDIESPRPEKWGYINFREIEAHCEEDEFEWERDTF